MQWYYLPWRDLRDVGVGDLSLDDVLVAPAPRADPGAASQLTKDETDRCQELMALQARDSPLRVDGWFDNVVKAAPLPAGFADELRASWKNIPDVNARSLLSLAALRGELEGTAEKHGDLAIGWILVALARKLGNPDRRDVAAMVLKHRMLTRPADIAEVQALSA